MAKNRQSKKNQRHPAPESPHPSRTAAVQSPFLPVAHPPAKSPTLLAVSVILFAVWFLFLLLAALSS